jgi:hypothetical protein
LFAHSLARRSLLVLAASAAFLVFLLFTLCQAAKFHQTYFAAARCSLSIILAGINFFYLTDAK